MKRKNFEVATPRETARDYEPQRWPSPRSDVVTPLLQALITALVLTAVPGGVLWRETNLSFGLAVALTFSIVLALAWLWRLGVITDTLWRIEEATGIDITRDKKIGKPRSIQLDITNGNSQQIMEIEGIGTPDELRKLAILAVTHRLNERAAMKEFNWSRTQWTTARDELITRRLVTWNGDNGTTQGVDLTKDGEDVMRAILDNVSPTDADLR